MNYFGTLVMYAHDIKVPPPVGEPCGWCDEPIIDTDEGIMLPTIDEKQETPFHHSCYMRSVIGSVAHVTKQCSCFVDGSEEGDPPDMTKREAAIASVNAYKNLFLGR